MNPFKGYSADSRCSDGRGGSKKHTATVTPYEGSLTLKLDGVVAQSAFLFSVKSAFLQPFKPHRLRP